MLQRTKKITKEVEVRFLIKYNDKVCVRQKVSKLLQKSLINHCLSCIISNVGL